MSRPAIFLDRDGVINRKRPEGDYVRSWGEFEFLPGVLDALAAMAQTPARIIVVTNQRGIARGRLTEADLAEIHARMVAAIGAHGGRIDAIYYCPHEGGCDCRKPRTGLFEQALRDFPDTDLANSVVIGDSLSDMEAAARVGCRAMLIAEGERRLETLRDAAGQGVVIEACMRSLGEWENGVRARRRPNRPPAPCDHDMS